MSEPTNRRVHRDECGRKVEQAERALADAESYIEDFKRSIARVSDENITLRATLARVEGERDSLIRQLVIADREVRRRGEERDGLRAERDHAREIADALYEKERGLRAALEARCSGCRTKLPMTNGIHKTDTSFFPCQLKESERAALRRSVNNNPTGGV